MSKYQVIVTDDRHHNYDPELEVLAPINADLQIHNLEREKDPAAILASADGILVNLFPLPASIIAGLKKCKVISRYGVGYDNVDVEAATQANIWVTRVPDYAIEDVSDHALALLLCAVRKIAFKDRMIRQEQWNLHRRQPIHRIQGRVLGLVGFGLIARAFLRKVKGLGLGKILIYDPFVAPSDIQKEDAEPADLETLLQQSDYISLHAPLSLQTTHMIGQKQFDFMKKEAILINTSRGALVDEKILTDALTSQRIAYAGLDVFEQEPLPLDSPLRKLDNVIISDHAGWYSEEAMIELKRKAALNIVQVLKGEKPAYRINFIENEAPTFVDKR